MEQRTHIPVMLDEAIDYLDVRPGKTIVDATVGLGGHSRRILERLGESGRLVAIDRDEESLAMARQTLEGTTGRRDLVYANFLELDAVLDNLHIPSIDGILFDLGVSSFQLEDPQRGFSFQQDGPLDMRLDRNSYICAYDLVNNLNEEEISQMLWSFGQERWHNRIAREMVEVRQRRPISTTEQLSHIVLTAIPRRYRRYHYRIHPATRTFQAIRIAVNRELEALENAIARAVGRLAPGGRICVISFHSLEDRVVKLALRAAAARGQVTLLTPKPLTPRETEVSQNPRSRSAKFRAAQRL